MAPGLIGPEPAVSGQDVHSLQSVTSSYGDVLQFYLNGTKVVLDESIDPEITLLEYLRGIGLTGTKLGCAEGGKTLRINYFESTDLTGVKVVGLVL